jgi:flagellar hook-associated protein FlgK
VSNREASLIVERDKLKRELDEAREQRDRLEEEMSRIANNRVQDTPQTDYAYEFGRMEGIAKIALAAVKGGRP